MVRAGKSSAVADVAAQLGADQARSLAHTGAAPGGDDQADLLRDVEAFNDELSLFDGVTVQPRRGPGRPPGSPNRSTVQLKRLLHLKGYRDPVEFLASLYTMDTRELAAALRADAGAAVAGVPSFDQAHEALKLQIRAAEAALPYLHQKMPIAVEHSGDGQRPIIIVNDQHGLMQAGRVVAGDAVMSVHDPLEYQGVSASPAPASHDVEASQDG
jgi:hypothetical protein